VIWDSRKEAKNNEREGDDILLRYSKPRLLTYVEILAFLAEHQ
jgi:hypothetical protein